MMRGAFYFFCTLSLIIQPSFGETIYETIYGLVYERCPFVDYISDALAESLPKAIAGQHMAVESIIDAVRGWENSKRTGTFYPLVLAIAGPIGVGKSETAYKIADAIFQRSTRVGSTSKRSPNGLLVLRGEDYSKESGKDIDEMHKSIKLRVIKHLEACSGNALILFDEVQKAKHGALDALIPGMDERGSLSENIETTSYFGYPIVTLHTVSTVNTIFVFISDIGADILEKQLVYYEDRDDIPKKVLRATIKKAMNAKWDDINFGKLIKEVIPYFPMERKEIEDVFRLKIRAYALHYTLIKWYYLIVDESVINYLCSPRFVEYRPVAQNFSSSLEGTVRSSTKIFAVEGGRNLENGGPLNDLQSLLMRVMQPWQTSKILHVGLLETSEDKGPVKVKLDLQWCELDEEKAFNLQLCSTKWSGELSK